VGSVSYVELDFSSNFIRVHPCASVVLNPWLKKIAASAPSQGVVAGMETLAALYDGATGGMSADILLAHNIAAAKVRWQSR